MRQLVWTNSLFLACRNDEKTDRKALPVRTLG